jgi:hypothetical protein
MIGSLLNAKRLCLLLERLAVANEVAEMDERGTAWGRHTYSLLSGTFRRSGIIGGAFDMFLTPELAKLILYWQRRWADGCWAPSVPFRHALARC